MLKQILSERTLAREGNKKDALGKKNHKVYQGDALMLKDPNSLTYEIREELE